jgi:radical SAM superfamily enzyme YgiQ (UPF0313 family)
MATNILLNCFPPAFTMRPNPALSILKSFMVAQDYQVEIKYWNLALDNFKKNFFDYKAGYFGDDRMGLFPFINYIWVKSGQHLANCSMKQMLLSLNPRWYNLEADYVENKMEQYANELEQIIENEIAKMNLEKYQVFGITTKFHQWICGGIIAQKVKELYPKIKIVVGGFGTSDEALALMNNFDYYDFAIWGEGEYPLLYLCEKMDSLSFAEVPCLIYRDKSGVPQISMLKKREYFNLNSEIFPDYSDYFVQVPDDMNMHELPFESNRGCHWNKCRFCYLNDGYRYRAKANETVIKELRYQIEKHQVRSFNCLDNDMIGVDSNKFELLLDELIKLKMEYVDFKINIAEIITKNINSAMLKKMSLAGINHIQIGYESSSNNLLQKINKKNTFASNLLCIKWANEYHIAINGVNVIQGLLEETIEDIFEATNNLYHLRFFLSNKIIKHSKSSLAIAQSSPYYQDIEKNNKLVDWDVFFFSDLLPDKFSDYSDKFYLFQHSNKYQDLSQWNYFYKVEEHFINSKYDYQIINNSGVVHYREYFNNALVNELVFEDPLHWDVLTSCNHRVVSLKDLCITLFSYSSDEVKEAVETLKSEGLLYHNDDFTEIVTPINTDIIS